MPIFILTWNPTKWAIDDEEYSERVEWCANGDWEESDWSVGGRKRGIVAGDYGILLRQHDARGVVAAGEFTGEIRSAKHWDGSKRLANYAPIHWTSWLPIEDRLPIEQLKDNVPGVAWDYLQMSGIEMSAGAAATFAPLWSAHLEGLGLEAPTSPDELSQADSYLEGAAVRVKVNRYERDPRARAEALRLHGTSCSICDFDFGDAYGPEAKGFIHVHHIRDLATLGTDYSVDPAKDLIPVCPNCHAMLHRTRPATPPEVLRERLARP